MHRVGGPWENSFSYTADRMMNLYKLYKNKLTMLFFPLTIKGKKEEKEGREGGTESKSVYYRFLLMPPEKLFELLI